MTEDWNRLYILAMQQIWPMKISNQMQVGAVAAAILTKKGTIYTGICIDSSCSLGMCAERNALSTMLANHEHEVDKVVAVYKDGTVLSPCGACREFMMQLGESAKDIEVLLDRNGKVIRLLDLLPEYVYES